MVRRTIPVLLVLASLFLSVATTAADGTWMYYSQGALAYPLVSLAHYHAAFTVSHDRERYRLNWTTGLVAVNFHIMDQSNYDNWTLGRTWTGLVDHLNTTGEYFEWVTWDENQTFHFIWFNPSLLSTNLIGKYNIDQWIEIEGNIPGFPWQAILVGLLLPVALLLAIRRRR
jgi:hypothetical protein